MAAIGKFSFFDSLDDAQIPISFRVDEHGKKDNFTLVERGEGTIQKHRDDKRYVIITCGTYEFALSPADLQTLYKSSRIQQKICTRMNAPEQVREFHFSEGKLLVLDFTLNPMFSFKYPYLAVTRYTITAQSL